MLDDYGIIIPSITSIFTIAADQRNSLKSDPTPNVFLKIFNNFENSFPSTKQLWMAASSFPEKSWRYLVKRIFVGQNIRKPVSYSPFLSDGSAIIFILLKESRAKIKVYTFFFIINSIFHLRLPRDVNFRLKIANF